MSMNEIMQDVIGELSNNLKKDKVGKTVEVTIEVRLVVFEDDENTLSFDTGEIDDLDKVDTLGLYFTKEDGTQEWIGDIDPELLKKVVAKIPKDE